MRCVWRVVGFARTAGFLRVESGGTGKRYRCRDSRIRTRKCSQAKLEGILDLSVGSSPYFSLPDLLMWP